MVGGAAGAAAVEALEGAEGRVGVAVTFAACVIPLLLP